MHMPTYTHAVAPHNEVLLEMGVLWGFDLPRFSAEFG